MKKLVLFFTGVLLLTACNKTKTVSNRLDGQKWQVTELSVDGVNQSSLTVLKFSECEIYKESCTGQWYLGETGHAGFAWQIRDKGKTLEISNQADHAHGLEDVKAAEQCIAFSGVYKILENKRKNMSFETTTAHAYKGKKVIIKMERKD